MEMNNTEQKQEQEGASSDDCINSSMNALALETEEAASQGESMNDSQALLRLENSTTIVCNCLKVSDEMFGDIHGEGVIDILFNELKRVMEMKIVVSFSCPDQAAFRSRMSEIVGESITTFDEHADSAIQVSRIKYWKLRGYLLLESYSHYKEAADALAKAVKLDPSAVFTWNKLGELYCYLGDLDMAKQCFLSALKQENNINSLHNLSILTRKQTRTGHCDDGLNYAKAALALDFSNSKSWTILGNAYMSEFFLHGQNESILRKAMYAYSQAEKGNPGDVEVCTNRFVAMKFLEDYEGALKCLQPCRTNSDVAWRNNEAQYDALLTYLKNIQLLVDRKGKLRTKKRLELVKALTSSTKPNDSKQSNSATSPSQDTMVCGTTIGVLCPDVSFPYTVAILTATEDVYIVTIFNLHSQRGFKLGDIFSVPAKYKTDVNITHGEHVFHFTKFRIPSPMEISVNGKKMTKNDCIPFSFVSSPEN